MRPWARRIPYRVSVSHCIGGVWGCSMRIVPKDLGLTWHVRFLLARDSTNKVGAEPPEPHLGVVGRLCSRGMDLDERSAAALVPAAREAISYCVVPFLPALPLACISSVVVFVALHAPIG